MINEDKCNPKSIICGKEINVLYGHQKSENLLTMPLVKENQVSEELLDYYDFKIYSGTLVQESSLLIFPHSILFVESKSNTKLIVNEYIVTDQKYCNKQSHFL